MYVVVGSQTTAARLARAVEKAIGHPARVVHTPQPIRRGGCSYSVQADDRALAIVKQLALDYGISKRKIYTTKLVNGERVYHALS